MNISKTSEKLLSIFFNSPEKQLYINELIRLTGLLPNSVYQALKTLEKQQILRSTVQGRFRFYQLNTQYQYLNELKSIILDSSHQISTPSFKWIKILNRQTSHSFTSALCNSNTTLLKKIYGISVSSFWLNDITHGVYYSKEELQNLGKAIASLIESDNDFAKKDISLCKKTCNQLVTFSKSLTKINLTKLNNQDLAKQLDKFYNQYLAVFPFVTVPHAIERHFEEKIKKQVADKKIQQLLLSPVALTDQERDDAFKTASYIKKNGLNSQAQKLITKHWQKYTWLPMWSIYNQPFGKQYFKTEIKNILDNITDPQQELKRLKLEEAQASQKLEKAFKKIKASRALKEQVKFLQEYIHLRVLRKNTICQAHYYHLPLFYEAGKRLKLTKKQTKLLSHQELIHGLSKKLSSKEITKIVKNRQKGWAILMLNGKLKTIIGNRQIIETIERYNIVSPTSDLKKIIKGNSACHGKVVGKVKIINKLSELNKINKGDILVTKMTTPDYMVAIHKAAAIVTDEGGVTCHAAIVSREFNIPCIVATQNATQVLTDNTLIEVNAYIGEVQILESLDFPENIKKIQANSIYKGKVKGTAKIIQDSSDFSKIKSGDILITSQTTPEFLSALYRVKGFIVDENSLTSHAVLSGKALKIPSVMGAQFARHAIKDGEKIELDATKGLIRRLSV